MNMEQFRHTEQVKLCYLKNRGNVLEISKELNLPLEYIQKLVKKFKGEEEKDVAVRISNNLMSYLFFGYQSRVHNFMAMFKNLDGRDKNKVSVCCEAPVERMHEESDDQGRAIYECLACHLVCSAKVVNEEGIIDLQIGVLEQLREEDRALVDFCEKMGYTNKSDQPSPIVFQNKQNILILGNSEKDKTVLEQSKNLSMMDKERLVEQLRKEITTLDSEIQTETNKETKNDK